MVTTDCIFCKIHTTSWLDLSNDRWKIIKDINPQAKTHMLLVPTIHIENWVEVPGLLEQGLQRIKSQIKGPYFVRINQGAPYKEVPHCHIHVMSEYPLDCSHQIC